MDAEDLRWRFKLWALRSRLAIGTIGVLLAIGAFGVGLYAFLTGERTYFGFEVEAVELGSLYLTAPVVVALGSVFVMVAGIALALKWS
jgi:hypothetical protein